MAPRCPRPDAAARSPIPPELPVSERRDDIAAAIRDHQVVIVAGETGSGKTTQLPKICLELGRGVRGGARTAATDRAHPAAPDRRPLGRRADRRRARHRAGRPGRLPGAVHRPHLARHPDQADDRRHPARRAPARPAAAQVRHDHHRRGPRAEPQHRLPARLPQAAAAEAARPQGDHHLGHDRPRAVRRALRRPARKPAPIIEVSGRTYPVEVRYRPLVELPDEEDEEGEAVVRDQTEAIVDAVRELSAEGPGDILVFLPGEREIRDTADALADVKPDPGRRSRSCRSTPGSRPPSSTGSSPRHPRRRRVVLATNVAETSLTVPGIRYVVDTGVARISRYSTRTKVQRLPIEPISQASANQRSGRCGRVEAGIAIRLYSEEDFECRPEFTDPEILRTNLASVILQMTSLGARRPRPVPVRRAARQAQRHRRRPAPRGARCPGLDELDRRRQAA